MVEPLSSRATHGPWGVPQSLGDLRGPKEGIVPLPLRLCWSGAGSYNVADPSERLALYQIVLTEGDRSDIESYVNAAYLTDAWPRLRRMLGPRYRSPWEERFPTLVEVAGAAEPALREELRRSREAIRRELSS